MQQKREYRCKSPKNETKEWSYDSKLATLIFTTSLQSFVRTEQIQRDKITMGSILTSMKNAVDYVKRFNATNSRIRQNISDVRKCTKDITSIVRDFNSISCEVKTAIKECSLALQTKLYQQICNRLSDKDLEYVHHILFYKEFLSHIAIMETIDKEISSGDIIGYLLDQANDEIRRYKKIYCHDEGRYRLLVEMEKFLEINNHYELDSFSLSDEENTMMTSIETIKEPYDMCTKGGSSEDKKQWIPMALLGKSKEGINYIREKRTRKSGLLQLCKWKKKNVTEGSANVRCIKTLTSLLNLQQQLLNMINDHLSRTSYAETRPVRAFILKHIVDGENHFDIDKDVFTPRMAKINSKLEKIIKKHDLTEINLRMKINPEINFREAIEILDDAARKVHTVKNEVIENTKNTKDFLMMDIEAFGIDEPENENCGFYSSEMLPFRNTMGLLKGKGSKKIENGIESILKRHHFIENIQARKLVRLADIVIDKTEYIMQPKHFIQHVLHDGNYGTLLLLRHIIGQKDGSYQGRKPFSIIVTEKALSQVTEYQFLQEMLGNEENLKTFKSVIISMVDKLALKSLDEKNILDTIFQYLLNERHELLAKINDVSTRNIIRTVLNEEMKKILITVARYFNKDAAMEGAHKICHQIYHKEAENDLELFMQGLHKAFQFKTEKFSSTSHQHAILLKELLLRVLN